jgi:programmed cell death protein 5
MNLDEIKAKKIEEYQKRFQEEVQKAQVGMVKRAALLKYMTKEARERLNRVRLVKPEIVERVELALIQAVQMGQIRDIITDEQLKNILTEVMEKREFKIKKNR